MAGGAGGRLASKRAKHPYEWQGQGNSLTYNIGLFEMVFSTFLYHSFLPVSNT
jgi:hypothetical protein